MNKILKNKEIVELIIMFILIITALFIFYRRMYKCKNNGGIMINGVCYQENSLRKVDSNESNN